MSSGDEFGGEFFEEHKVIIEPICAKDNLVVNSEESLVQVYYEECNVCDEKFVRFTNLRDHMIQHLSDFPQQCTTCLAVFITSEELYTHCSLKHSAVKPSLTISDFEEVDGKGSTLSWKCNQCGLFFNSVSEFQSHHIDIHVASNDPKVLLEPLNETSLSSYGVNSKSVKIKAVNESSSRSGTPDSVSSLSSSGSSFGEKPKLKPLKLKIKVTSASSEDESQDNSKHFEIVPDSAEASMDDNSVNYDTSHLGNTMDDNNEANYNMNSELSPAEDMPATTYPSAVGVDPYPVSDTSEPANQTLLEPSVPPIPNYGIDGYSEVPGADVSDSIESGVANYMIRSENSVPEPPSEEYQYNYPVDNAETRQLTLLSGPSPPVTSDGSQSNINSLNSDPYNYYNSLSVNPDSMDGSNGLNMNNPSMLQEPNNIPPGSIPESSLQSDQNQSHFVGDTNSFGEAMYAGISSDPNSSNSSGCPPEAPLSSENAGSLGVTDELSSISNIGQYSSPDGSSEIPPPQPSPDIPMNSSPSATIVPSSIANISNMALSTTSYLAQPSAGQMAQTSISSVGSIPAPVTVPVTVPVPYRPSTYRSTTAPMPAPQLMAPSNRMSYRPLGPMGQMGYTPRGRMPNMGSVQRMPSMRGMGPMPNGMNIRGNYPSMSPIKRLAQPVHSPNTPTKRRSLSFPSQQNDSDCQIIAVQKRTEGVPVIQNVQGSRPNGPESTIHLSDSITLSVRPSPEKERPQPNANHNSGSGGGDATAVASLLATRGITVTPAANANGNSPVSNKGSNQNSFAVPRTPVNPRVDRPPRPPTVDLTHEDNMRNNANRNARSVMCQICDRNFATPDQLNNHMKLHRMNQLPYQCNVCNASFGNQVTLNQHKIQKHGSSQGINDTHGIPVVNIAAPGVSQNLSRLGIQGVIPLSNLQNKANGCLGIPILSLNAARNGIGFNLQSAGITNMLTLGPLKPIQK